MKLLFLVLLKEFLCQCNSTFNPNVIYTTDFIGDYNVNNIVQRNGLRWWYKN